MEFVELDKQAHKIVIAYLLAKYEEYVCGVRIDWEALILQFCFEFFERIVLTDIKPPVFHKLQAHLTTMRLNGSLILFIILIPICMMSKISAISLTSK